MTNAKVGNETSSGKNITYLNGTKKFNKPIKIRICILKNNSACGNSFKFDILFNNLVGFDQLCVKMNNSAKIQF